MIIRHNVDSWNIEQRIGGITAKVTEKSREKKTKTHFLNCVKFPLQVFREILPEKKFFSDRIFSFLNTNQAT